jgi:hypothetical protein
VREDVVMLFRRQFCTCIDTIRRGLVLKSSHVLTDAAEEARYRTTPNTVMERLAALRFLYS